jgi:protein phosphatase
VIRLAWGSASHVGRVRQSNEDALFASEELFVVADGMGGHRGGEVASVTAIASLRSNLNDLDEVTTDGLVQAVQLANDAVVNTAVDDPELAGMGTTLCAIAVVHVPDDEHDAFAWWPADPGAWPEEAHPALRRVGTLLESV